MAAEWLMGCVQSVSILGFYLYEPLMIPVNERLSVEVGLITTTHQFQNHWLLCMLKTQPIQILQSCFRLYCGLVPHISFFTSKKSFREKGNLKSDLWYEIFMKI